ncbi:MAG: hypothetical protein IK099_14415 [Clostridia bacterium]|nr:hypothetical protein [Clostridia bacterium]
MLAAAAFGALAGAMMVFPEAAAEAAYQALGLWARAVAPVLGPFMACMLMLSSRTRGGMAARVAMGWLCGSPGGARLMREAGLRGRSASRTAAMTGTMSPMFLIGTVGGWLGDRRLGWVVFLCHVLGALGAGLCIPPGEKAAVSLPAPMPLGAALRESALALLTVALCMMLGCAAAKMAACALPGLAPAFQAALQCALEVTGGVKSIIALQTPFTAPLVCAAVSFGGLSLLAQNAAFWQDSGVGMGRLALLRLFHALLSGALCRAVLLFFP